MIPPEQAGADSDGVDNPFASGPSPASQPGEETAAPEKAMNYWGLRNSDPPVTPDSIGRELDLAAKWYDHLFCGFMKQSSSDGAEAWMHYVVAAILLANSELDLLSQEEVEEIEEEADGDSPRWQTPEEEWDTERQL